MPRCFRCESTVMVSLGSAAATALCHFQLQPRRIDAGLLQRVLNVIHESSVRKLPRRYVYRNIHGLFGRALIGLPLAQLAASLQHQPVPDGDQDAGVLGRFNEPVGRDQSCVG